MALIERKIHRMSRQKKCDRITDDLKEVQN